MPRKRSSQSTPSRSRSFQYDVSLSFAGEDRRYVETVASSLKAAGIRVFYDRHQEVELWGKDLYEHLDYVYRKAARFSVLFISRHYAARIWPNHERRSMQARALRENEEYILPVRFDSTEVPGLRETIGYISLKNRSPRALAKLILQKLGPRQNVDFLPPLPDRLYRRMKATSSVQREEVYAQLESFHSALTRMDADERKVVLDFFWCGCPLGRPKEVHINLDFLRRETEFPIAKLRHVLGNVSSLGFVCQIKERERHGASTQDVAHLKYYALRVAVESPGPHNAIVEAVMEEVSAHLCPECSRRALLAGDFSQLSSATMTVEKHG